jgi:hypothetical protein
MVTTASHLNAIIYDKGIVFIVVEEQKTVIQQQFSEQLAELDRQLNDAKREHTKAGTKQYFSYIVAFSFIGGGNRRTWMKPTTCRNVTEKLYHIMLYRVHFAMSRI